MQPKLFMKSSFKTYSQKAELHCLSSIFIDSELHQGYTVYSLNIYVLSTYGMAGTVLDFGDTAINKTNKTDKISAILKVKFYLWNNLIKEKI